MTMDGGGWTLVYSYGFTDYNSFGFNNNAVTPIPGWMDISEYTGGTPTSLSTTPPQGPLDHGAIDFNLWKHIGSDFIVKSNINNVVKCSDNVGSLVNMRLGSIFCEVLDSTVAPCNAAVNVPNEIYEYDCGIAIGKSSFYYYWDGCIDARYPTHDPCGVNQANQKQGVTNPYGNIYIR